MAGVAPCAGAGIETAMAGKKGVKHLASPPARGRGLKLCYCLVVRCWSGRPLRGGGD